MNDLGTLRPDIAARWDFERNEAIPADIGPDSHLKAYWIGEAEKRRVSDFVADHTEIFEQNPISSTHPELAEWFAADSPVSPHAVPAWSNTVASFSCPEGHRWEEKVRHLMKRTEKGKCPVCSFRILVPGVNDLKTTHPELAHTLADELLAVSLKRNSSDVVEWCCEAGHAFSASVASRVAGSGCPVCANKIVLPGVNDLATTHPALASIWAEDNTVLPTQITAGSETSVNVHCQECDSVFSMGAYILKRRNRWTCAGCVASVGEVELSLFIESLGFEVVRNTRSVIKPLEIDVWVPSRNVGFEFNGIFWHSDGFVADDYHQKKWDLADAAGVQLIAVWEDDWRDRAEVVKSMIRHKLGVSESPKVNARSCSVEIISPSRAKDFLEETHIQGSMSGAKYTALLHEGSIVAVMATSIRKGALYVDRFATSATVRGGFSKLLQNVIAASSFSGQVVSFADRMVSDGKVYEMTGFEVESMIPPDYSYVYQASRHHKFNFRKKRFEKDNKLVFHPDMTEKELAELNKLRRIWDAGKLRMVKEV